MNKSGSNSKNFRWILGGNISVAVISIISSIILLKYLSPEIFGIFGMATPIIGFLAIINSFATSTSIVSRKEISQSEINTLIVTKIIVSIILIAICCGVSYPISVFFGESQLQHTIILLSLTLLFYSTDYVFQGLLQRQQKFSKLTLSSIYASLLSNTISIILAIKGYGLYTLIYRELLNSLFLVLFHSLFTRWKINWKFNSNVLSYHLNFGKNVTFENLLNFGARNFDDILIGKKFGAEGLGLYTKAYGLMDLPTQMVSKAIVSLLLPQFSKVQNNKQAVLSLYLKASRLTMITSALISLTLYFIIENLINIFSLDDWTEIIALIKVLVLFSMIQCIGPLQDLIYQGTNKTKAFVKQGIIIKIYQISSILVAYIYSSTLLEFVIFIVCFFALSVLLSLYFISITIKEKFILLLKNIVPILVVIILTLFICKYLFNIFDFHSALLALFLKAVTILVVFICMLILIANKMFHEWINNIKQVIRV